MAYQLWQKTGRVERSGEGRHISYGILVMAYQLWHISYGILGMAYQLCYGTGDTGLCDLLGAGEAYQ